MTLLTPVMEQQSLRFPSQMKLLAELSGGNLTKQLWKYIVNMDTWLKILIETRWNLFLNSNHEVDTRCTKMHYFKILFFPNLAKFIFPISDSNFLFGNTCISWRIIAHPDSWIFKWNNGNRKTESSRGNTESLCEFKASCSSTNWIHLLIQLTNSLH